MANIETSMSFTSTTQGGDKLQKAITDINPNAAGDKLVGFAQRLNALTTNNYTGATKIVKQELSSVAKTEAKLYVGGTYASPVFETTVERSKLTIENDDCFINLDCKINSTDKSDGKPFIVSNSAGVAVDFVQMPRPTDCNWSVFLFSYGSVSDWCATAGDKAYNLNGDAIMEVGGTGAGDIVIALAESDTYAQSNTVTIHVTA